MRVDWVGRVMETRAGFEKVATKAEVPIGAMKSVDVDGTEILLCNVGGELFAVHDECTHECFPLSEGTLEGHAVACRLHGARFDVRNGEVLALPAHAPLRTHEVRIECDDILIAK